VLGYDHIELEEQGCGTGTEDSLWRSPYVVHLECTPFSKHSPAVLHPQRARRQRCGAHPSHPEALSFRNSVLALCSHGTDLTNTTQLIHTSKPITN